MSNNLAKYCLCLALLCCGCSMSASAASCIGLDFTTAATLLNPCKDSCSAQATLIADPTGGSGTFSYLWSPGGETSLFAQNLCAGTVTLTITDVGNACDSVVTFIVTEPPAVTAVFSQTMTCNGQCSGIATVFVGGGCSGNVCPYNYTWTNVTTTTTITGSVDSILAFPILCPGDYTFSATDQIGCPPGTANVTILEATPLVPTITLSTNASCPSVCDGLTNSTATGSVPPYTYSWDDTAAQTTADATGLCGTVAGITYTLTVTDSLGCIETASVAIQEPEPITVTFATTDPSCGGTCDGSGVISNPIGGTSPYTYTWSSGQTSSTVINSLCAGNGSVTITDARDCDTIVDFTLIQPPGLEGSVMAFSDCDAAGNLIATATANPTSGTGPYTYTWNDAASQSTQMAIGLTIGQTYNVIVLDASGCRLDETTTIPIALCDLVIPNTFTPNDDSFNDIWFIENLINYTQANLKVYNRWGDIVFSSTGYDTPWEGKSAGVNLPAAVYYYVLDVPELDKNYAGQVTIVR